jgi:starch synthase (maltosyl-transferring)
VRDWDAPGNLVDYITRINQIRRENRALHLYRNLRFHPAENPSILWYGKSSEDGENRIFVAANMDAAVVHDSFVEVPIDELGIPWNQPYVMQELISGRRYEWVGPRGYVKLYPDVDSAQIFRLER